MLPFRSALLSNRYSFSSRLRSRFSSGVSSFGRIDKTLRVESILCAHSDFGPDVSCPLSMEEIALVFFLC